MDIEDFLKQEFKSLKQMVLAPYYNGAPQTLEDLTYEELEGCAAFKPSMKISAIVGDHNTNKYNSHRLHYINCSPEACLSYGYQVFYSFSNLGEHCLHY